MHAGTSAWLYAADENHFHDLELGKTLEAVWIRRPALNADVVLACEAQALKEVRSFGTGEWFLGPARIRWCMMLSEFGRRRGA